MAKDSEDEYDGSEDGEEDDDEEEDDEGEEVVPALATRERRTNRAQHMSSLISEVVEKGDQFWRNDDWAMSEEEGGESADDSFELSAEEDKPDEFDSDFNDTEDEEDEEGGSDDEEEGGRSGRRRGGGGADNKASGKTKAGKVTIGAAKKPSVYKEPPKPKPRAASSSAAAGPRAPVDREAAKKRRAEEFQVQLQAGDEVAIAKRVRQSTKQKTQHAEAERQQRQQIQLVIGSKRPPKSDSKPTFNQRDMLTEALETEQVNTKWLRIQQMVEDEMAKSDKHALLDGSKKLVRHLARRGTYPTITFVNSETLPEVLQVSSQTRPSVPVQTGAKYRDPVTGRPYNTAEEFRALRSESGVPFVYR